MMGPYREPAPRPPAPPTFDDYQRPHRRWSGLRCWFDEHVAVLVRDDGRFERLPSHVTTSAIPMRSRHVLLDVKVRCLYCRSRWGMLYGGDDNVLRSIGETYGKDASAGRTSRPTVLNLSWR